MFVYAVVTHNNMRKYLFILFSLFSLIGKAQTIEGTSSDSLIKFYVYEDTANTTKLNFSDSILIQKGELEFWIREFSDSCLKESKCDTLYDELWTPCQAFRLPRFVRCIKINDFNYALIGYSTDHPIQVKHIWILQNEKALNIETRIALICRRTLDYGIDFDYDKQTNQISINSDQLALIDEHVYQIDDCRLSQNDITITEQIRTKYSIWLSDKEEKHLQQLESKKLTIKLK